MESKYIDKVYLSNDKTDSLIREYLEKKVSEVFSDLNDVIPMLKERKKLIAQRYYYLKNYDLYFDFSTGVLFPNISKTLKFNFNHNHKTLKEIWAEEEKDLKEDNKYLFDKLMDEVLNSSIDFPQECKGKVIFVNSSNKNKKQDGISWDSAFSSFDKAYETAQDYDQLWIAKGDYTSSYVIKKNIEIYGGFSGVETEGWQRYITKSITNFNNNLQVEGASKLIKLNGLRLTGIGIRSSNFEISNTSAYSTLTIYESTGFIRNFYVDAGSRNNRGLSSYRSTLDVLHTHVTNSSYAYISEGVDVFYFNSAHSNSNYGAARYIDKLTENMIKNSKIVQRIKLVKEPKDIYHSLKKLIKNDLCDFNFDGDVKDRRFLISLIYLKENEFYLEKEKFINAVLNKEFKSTVNGISFDLDAITLSVKNSKFSIDSDVVKNDLLQSDYRRAGIEPYDKKMLEDINRGHWELWDNKLLNQILVPISEKIVARNPSFDIKEGVIAIDFGTKSTVVACQTNTDQILPLRIGKGNYKEAAQYKDYENPTIVEFIDINQFLNSYIKKPGRPYTSWEDITVSHTASINLRESTSNQINSFFQDLKKWASLKDKKVKLTDKKGEEFTLNSFLETSDGLNPIEIYAYYLGLYINNQYNGIYFKYLLTYPVTYENEIKEKIRKSFELGLKKSLPQSLLDDAEVMKKFRVELGQSEPAAYAATALLHYASDIKDDETIYYSIFDFGGGTTDFDFGIWSVEEKDTRKYDYNIKHFGNEGDRYLGGENLLELLANHVFKNNQDYLLKNSFAFSLHPEMKKWLGSEGIVNDSQEAKRNTRTLMELLRPFWEDKQDDLRISNEKAEDAEIELSLTNSQGIAIQGCKLKLNIKNLEEILKDRVREGVQKFFGALDNAFKVLDSVETIEIFLAGNSTKSKLVQEIFKEEIDIETKKGTYKFNLHMPLGHDNPEFSVDDYTPDAKTGVAFGLISCRPGGKIRVENYNSISGEAKFKYYLGYISRKNFNTLIDRDVEYNAWNYFIDASEKDFEIYYTDNPLAKNNNCPSNIAKKISISLYETHGEKGVYIKTISSNQIQYVIGTEEELKLGKFSSEIQTVTLQ